MVNFAFFAMHRNSRSLRPQCRTGTVCL